MPVDEDTGQTFEIPLAEALGASVTTVQRVSIYLPNKDRHGNQIQDIDRWIKAALTVLTELNGGATKLSGLEGSWRNSAGKIFTEDTVVVYSFLFYPQHFMEELSKFVSFVRTFGSQTDQEEVLVEFDNKALLVRDFDL